MAVRNLSFHAEDLFASDRILRLRMIQVGDALGDILTAMVTATKKIVDISQRRWAAETVVRSGSDLRGPCYRTAGASGPGRDKRPAW